MHVSDDDLARYALEPARIPGRAAIEEHLSACHQCREALQLIEKLDAELKERETWTVADEMTAGTDTLLALRRLAEEIATEDDEAAELLKDLEDAPAAFAFADIAGDPAYRTGGVVRRLCRLAAEARERDPRHALTLADTAIAIAGQLPDDTYSAGGIDELRGTAWKERANALRLLGSFVNAHDAIDHAERAYRKLPHAGLGIASVLYVRAWIMFEQGRYTEAVRLADSSSKAYAHLGDVNGVIASDHLQGNILFEQGRVDDALKIFTRVLSWGEAVTSTEWIGWSSQALGNCALCLNDPGGAARHFQRSLDAFRLLRMEGEIVRTQWGMGRIAAVRSPDRGIDALKRIAADFTRLGMLTDAALVLLDVVDLLLTSGRHHEVPRLTRGLVRTFTEAGMVSAALTALAFIREADSAGTLSHDVVDHVRRFIRRVGREPGLLFTPPPGLV